MAVTNKSLVEFLALGIRTTTTRGELRLRLADVKANRTLFTTEQLNGLLGMIIDIAENGHHWYGVADQARKLQRGVAL